MKRVLATLAVATMMAVAPTAASAHHGRGGHASGGDTIIDTGDDKCNGNALVKVCL